MEKNVQFLIRGGDIQVRLFSNMLGTNEPVELLPNMVVKGQIVFTTGRKGNNQPRNKYLLKENLLENTPSIINDGTSNDKLFKELGIDFEYPKTLAVAKIFT